MNAERELTHKRANISTPTHTCSLWRDKARAFAAGGSAVLGATELQRLLVLKEQLPSLSGELQEKAERKVVTLRSGSMQAGCRQLWPE